MIRSFRYVPPGDPQERRGKQSYGVVENGSHVAALPKPSDRMEKHGQVAKLWVGCKKAVSKVAAGLGPKHASAPALVPVVISAEGQKRIAVWPRWLLLMVPPKCGDRR